MKKLFLLCFTLLTFLSCSIDDVNNDINYNFEFIAIEDVIIPSTFVQGETYDITVSYYRPSTCHAFHDFYYLKDGATRTIAVINAVNNSLNCEDIEDELVEVSFQFIAVYNQVYVFKFWQGEDENGNDVYLIYEVPIVD